MTSTSLAIVAVLLAVGVASAQDRPPAPPAQQLAVAGRPGWVVDERTGCWLWSTPSKDEPASVAMWSGTCGRDGRATGHGTVEWRGGTGIGRYEGDYRDGKREGRGVYVWGDGARYEGEWLDDRPHGDGVLTIAKPQNVTLNGTWKGGCFRRGSQVAWIGASREECLIK